jgi:CrcB protein
MSKAVSQTSRERLVFSLQLAAGGALGTLARHLVSLGMPTPSSHDPRYPWGTMLINLVGSGILGFIVARAEVRGRGRSWVWPFLGVGFCGGFTTFSAVVHEWVLLMRAGQPGLGAIYLTVSFVGGALVALVTGTLAAHRAKHGGERRGGA